MQLSEFTYIFLTLCIPFLYYIVRSTSPKKGFSMLFAAIIALNVFLKVDNFSFLGLFFIAFYLYSYGKKESVYYLSLSFISFSAGLLGGITTGQDIVVRFAVKPTSSILIKQKTVNIKKENVEIQTKGRHDPCVGIRAVPIGEAMLALVLADNLLINSTRKK